MLENWDISPIVKRIIKKIISYRPWHLLINNYDHLISDLSHIDWSSLINSSKDPALALTNTLNSITNKHAPLRNKSVKSTSLPVWLDDEVRTLMRHRDFLKKSGNFIDYKIFRNKVTNLIKWEKKQAIKKIIATSPNSKLLWDTLLNRSAKSTSIASLRVNHADHGSSLLQDPVQIANALNVHFTSSASLASPPCTELSFVPPVSTPSSCPTIIVSPELQPVSPFDVTQFLHNLPHNKAVGVDSLGPKLLKLTTPSLILPLTLLYNKCLSTCSFPDSWKIAVVKECCGEAHS